MVSRWPIISQAQHIFNTTVEGSMESLRPMGVGYASIRKTVNNQAKTYHVFGTTLKAELEDVNARARELQALELKAFVKSRKISTSEAVIVAGVFNGDFNQRREHAERILHNMDSVLPEEVVGDVFYTYDPLKNNMCLPRDRRQWLDYIVIKNGYLTPKSASLQAYDLKHAETVTFCSCPFCLFVSVEYMYPDNQGCQSLKATQQYSDHYPLKAVFKY